MGWAVVASIAAGLAVGALSNIAFGYLKSLHGPARLLSVVVLAIVAAVGTGFAINTQSAGSTLTEATAPVDPYVKYLEDGYWDSTGQRPGIHVTDFKSPWSDRATFNLIESADYQVENSWVGDERPFLRAAVDGETSWQSSVDVEPGDTLSVYAWLMNSADPDLLLDSPDKRGDTVNARILLGYPEEEFTNGHVFSVVSADNTDPRWIAASVELRSNVAITLTPVEGSSVMQTGTNSQPAKEFPLPLAELARAADPHEAPGIAGQGALIGWEGANGRFKPAEGVNVVLRFTVTAAT